MAKEGHLWQGCAGQPFFPRGGAGQGEKSAGPDGTKVKIHGAGGAKKRVNQLIPKILQNCVNEKYNITYYKNGVRKNDWTLRQYVNVM